MGNSSSVSKAAIAAENKRRLTEARAQLEQAPFFQHLETFRASFSGRILLPNDAEYDEARNRPWNEDQRGYPLLILRPLNVKDVSTAVMFISEHAHSNKFCVACGCHSSRCMLNEAIVLDLIEINQTHLDRDNMTIEVGGGAYLKAIDDTLAPHKLAVTVGTYPYTGVGGLTLAGGYGWLARKFGLTVDNLISAEVVLHTGEVVCARDHGDYADLMWGLRGGGGNFGIVTKFTFKVHPIPPSCIGGSIVYIAPTMASKLKIVQTFDQFWQRHMNDHNLTGTVVFPAGAPVVPTVWSYFGEGTTGNTTTP
ncbi:FAD-binding oxidoreductase, partial [archaeon]